MTTRRGFLKGAAASGIAFCTCGLQHANAQAPALSKEEMAAARTGGGNIVRNTSVTPDGNFVLANSLVNAVTLVKIGK